MKSITLTQETINGDFEFIDVHGENGCAEQYFPEYDEYILFEDGSLYGEIHGSKTNDLLEEGCDITSYNFK